MEKKCQENKINELITHSFNLAKIWLLSKTLNEIPVEEFGIGSMQTQENSVYREVVTSIWTYGIQTLESKSFKVAQICQKKGIAHVETDYYITISVYVKNKKLLENRQTQKISIKNFFLDCRDLFVSSVHSKLTK